MWGLNTKDEKESASTAEWASLSFDNGNLTQIEENWKHGMKALYPISWTQPKKRKCYAPIPHTQTTPDGYFDCIEIAEDYEDSWKKQHREIKPLIETGAIIG
jgi:hypothetical protein